MEKNQLATALNLQRTDKNVLCLSTIFLRHIVPSVTIKSKASHEVLRLSRSRRSIIVNNEKLETES